MLQNQKQADLIDDLDRPARSTDSGQAADRKSSWRRRGAAAILGLLFVALIASRVWLSFQLWRTEPASTAADLATFRNRILSPTLNPDVWSIDLDGDARAYLRRQYNSIVFHIEGTQTFRGRLYTYADLTDGKWYTVTFRARAQQPRTIRIRAGADNQFGSTVASQVAALDTHWRLYRFVFQARKLPPHHTRVPEFFFGSTQGDVWFSDVRLVEGH